jgi:hypothetical protein
MSFLIEDKLSVFLIMTLLIGGGAAFMAGRSLALKWRPIWMPVLYMIPMGLGLRFLHFSLFNGNLASLHYWLTDTAVLIAGALAGYQMTRASQMVTQYPWLYDRAGPFGWKQKG